MQGTRVTFDPRTGNVLDESGNPVEGGPRINELYAGEFGFNNGYFYKESDPFNGWHLGQQGPASLDAIRGGRFILTSQIQNRGINRAINATSLRQIEGTVNVTIGDQEIQLNVDPIFLAATNHQWVYDPWSASPTKYVAVAGPFENNAEVATVMGPQARLASSEEAMYASLMKQLLTQNTDLIRQYADEHGIEGDETHSAEYNAIAAIIKEGGFENIRAFTSYIIE